MPNRIIKESICTSDNLDGLSWFEEVLFYRLIVNCDDYGRMDARPAILRSRLFPLKSVTDKQIRDALKSLRSAAMIDIYEVDGRSFLQMRTWEKHQQMRAKRSKYPAPASGTPADDSDLQASDIKCNQVQSNVPVIQSESESESKSESESRDGKRTRFVPPTIEEAEAFFKEIGGTIVQATRFHFYYASKGWTVGKSPMKDWKAAARGWVSREKDGGFNAGASGKEPMQRHGYTSADFKAMVTDLDADDSRRRKGKDGDVMQRYTPREREATYSAAVVDFDEEG